MRRHSTSRRLAIALATLLGLAGAVSGEVGVTDGPKGVVVNTRNGKAYAAFPDLGIVKIVNGVAGPVVTLKTGANVKNLTMDPRSGRVYAMNRGAGTISVIDPDSDAIVDPLKADRGSLTALNPVTNKLYVSASTGTDPSVIDLATKSSTPIHAGTEATRCRTQPSTRRTASSICRHRTTTRSRSSTRGRALSRWSERAACR